MRSSKPERSAPVEPWAAEWCLLQNQFDSYEKHALILKLASITVVLLALLSQTANVFIAGLLLLIWMQDAIWKTFQSRIEQRLLRIEASLAGTSPERPGCLPYQFNSEYLKGRGNQVSLLVEYARQALRPTVAFPHVGLLMLYILFLIFSPN